MKWQRKKMFICFFYCFFLKTIKSVLKALNDASEFYDYHFFSALGLRFFFVFVLLMAGDDEN
jgi:hypothetical protein